MQDIDKLPELAVASLERLMHYRCSADKTHWWAIADKELPKTLYCPHCGLLQRLPKVIKNGDDFMNAVVPSKAPLQPKQLSDQASQEPTSQSYHHPQ